MTSSPAPLVRQHRLRPPRIGPEDVERARLSTMILSTPPAGTCLVSAPPGYGATTAAVQAISGSGVAWLSLDGRDASPDAFWSQLVGAWASCAGEAPATLIATNGDGLSKVPELIEWMDSCPVEWLVVDGLDSEQHAAALPVISYLSANLPVSSRLIITTHDAPRRIAVDHADRRVIVVDRDQLAATPDESAEIALACSPRLDVDAVEEITAVADGWIVAVRAAARHADQHGSVSGAYWLSSEGAAILFNPWLDRLRPDRLRFLIDTVFLECLSGPLCDVSNEMTGSAALLEELEACGGYLLPSLPPGEPTGPPTRWWRRHALVTAALMQRAPLQDQSERNHRAARWFMEHGHFDLAMRHLVAAGRLEEAGSYLSTHENELFETGMGASAAAWYASLPAASWGPLGWHLVRMGWGHAISRSPHVAATTLAQLRAHLTTSPSDGVEQRVLQAEADTLAAYVASMSGDTAIVTTSARRAIELFCEESPDNSMQLAPAMLIRALLWEGDVVAARRELTRIEYQAFPTGVLRESLLRGLKAQCLTDEGYVALGRVEVHTALRWLGSQRLDPRDVAQFTLMTAEGANALESGEVATAIDRLRSTAAFAQEMGAIGDAIVALDWGARARIATAELGQALARVTDARRLLRDSAPSSPLVNRLDLTEAFIRHLGGDALRAERLVQRLPPSEARTLMWARVTMHRQSSAVRRALASVRTDTPRVAIEKQVLLAMVAMKRSSTLAEGHLLKVADIAGSNDFRMAFLGCPADLLELAAAVASRTSHDALRSLAGPRRSAGSEWVDEDLTGALPGTPQPLSPGELELLAFLPRRDTNADIARQLGVSVNTIKTRLYRLYRKLGVGSRDDAVQAARVRGLLDGSGSRAE